MYDLPVRDVREGPGCATGCGGAGHALITSGSRLLLFLVSPLFNLNGLLRSIGLSFPLSASVLGVCRPAVVISAETFGSWFCQGLWWTALLFESQAWGRGDAAQPLCATGVLIAVILRTFPPLVVEPTELFGEPNSFSGTLGGGGGVGPKWRISGPRLRRLRSQKYVKMAATMRKTATGIIASPAIDAVESPSFCCAGAAVSDIVAGIVGVVAVIVSEAIVYCCAWEIVACCMRIVGKGDNDGKEADSCGC